MRRSAALAVAALAFLASLAFVVVAPSAEAAPALTITPVTWNVVGLDSNDVTDGPNVFPVGVRVCNTGADPAANLTTTFVWDSENQYLSLESAASVVRPTPLAAGACTDVYWNVVVARIDAAQHTTRRFHVTAAADGAPAVSTTIGNELYVEEIISQQRNHVNEITGPTSLTVGDVVTYVVDADTAPGGYEQLEAFLTLNSAFFELISVDAVYEAPSGGTNDAVYADACGWDDDPASATYRSCIGPEGFTGGKAGGAILTEYTVRAVGVGTTTLTSTIYDKSGSSYHYNFDFGVPPNLLTVTIQAQQATTTTTSTTTSTSTPTTSTTVAPTTTAAPTTTTSIAVATAVATTGRDDTGPLTATGTTLLVMGGLLLLAVAVVPKLRPASPFERAVHDLRTTLYAHEDDPCAAQAWRLLDALDEVRRKLG